MLVLVDENIPSMTVEALRGTGHDVSDVRGTLKQGIHDDELWRLAQDEKRLLVTTDKGFTRFRAEAHHGLLVVLLAHPNRRTIHYRIMMALAQHQVDQWPGLTVVMRDRVKSVSRTKSK